MLQKHYEITEGANNKSCYQFSIRYDSITSSHRTSEQNFAFENKGADQLCSNCTADQHLCFRYMDSTKTPLLNPKFQAPRLFLRFYRPVCVGPGQKPVTGFLTSWLISLLPHVETSEWT